MYFLVTIQNIRIPIVKQTYRCIFTSSVKCNLSRENRFINKFLKRDRLNRDPIEQLIHPSSYEGKREKQVSIHTQKRMNVLNKVFMEHITDIMSTGEIEPEILNRSIEISHVKVTPDFKLVNVYWIDNSNEESDTEELLKWCAFELRHKLTQLHVIGQVPPIQFVKYKGINILKEVERKLNTLDVPKDYVASPYPDMIHHTITAITSDENESLETSEDSFSVTIPVMRHDVYGLDHYRIMSKIKSSLSKNKKALKKETIKAEANTSSPNLGIQSFPNFLTNNEQNEQFAKFINERRKQQRLKLKKRQFRADNSIFDSEEESNGIRNDIIASGSGSGDKDDSNFDDDNYSENEDEDDDDDDYEDDYEDDH